jgi:Domain of Unknown Function (DUF1259)
MNRKVAVSASAAVVTAMLLVATGFTGNNSQRLALAQSSSDEDKCMDSAQKISPDADGHASGNVCEIGLARGSPTITLLDEEANELVSNEIKYQPVSASSGDDVLIIAELGLLQSEVNSVQNSLLDKDWEVTAMHNHELHESPLLIFMHAQKVDRLDNVLQDLRDVLSQDTECDCT